MSQRDDFIAWVDTALIDAEVAIHNGDASSRRALWSRNDPVTVLGAWKNAAGQAELDELFAHLARSFSDCTSYELELLEAEVLGEFAYTVALEHTSASVDGVPRAYTLRATQVYRREDGEWNVVHRHGSAPPTFDESELRAAERRLEADLAADDPLAWVDDYTEDAVFDAGGEHAVVGRDSLLEMARSMNALRSVWLRPLRTAAAGDLATVWYEAGWLSDPPEGEATAVEMRGILVWRKEPDGVWRVAMEHIG